ncbi:dienelactone hydrolase family protein [Propylenella binzhouense]|uniref:Dienelactone hydrolase family protein n=1 Tax=Propylenella binzhouense TaxID=2555902 RepID=A0A964T712_9HYPH|nr:dienelactone hydrolase family protein [Propylenella binzhouense]MYZ49726.1 dienelactone hydrolase family protein [Propylenella binzhouense]
MNERPKITQEMIRLYDEYTHLTLDRRRFMDRLTKLAGSSAAAFAIAPMLEASKAKAAMLAEDDPRIKAGMVTWPGAEGTTLSGYLVTPADAQGPLPTVMVIHENRGLNPHIQDVARRVAVEGFLALAPDFLAPAGGTPEDEDKARQMISELDQAQTVANAVATVAYLDREERGNGKVGTVGFCWGGGLVNQTAVHAPDLDAAVAYYGRTPEPSQVPDIEASLLLHFAGLDDRINAGIPEYEAALKAAGKDYRVFVYEGANHAFNNDTSAARYDKAAADLAWSRTIAFLKEKLAA